MIAGVGGREVRTVLNPDGTRTPKAHAAGPTLFDEMPPSLPPFQKASPTSKDAAVAFAEHMPRVRREVYLLLLSRGSVGLTYKEAMAALHISSGTATARLNELKGGSPKRPAVVLAYETTRRRHRCAVVVERRFGHGPVSL